MDSNGYVENAIMQHGAVRAVHGWLDEGQDYRYVCVFHSSKPYLFKIVYRPARLDLAQAGLSGRGFVAEIVYGADKITAALPLLEPAAALVLLEDVTMAGTLVCKEAVQHALTAAYERRLGAA